MPNVNTAAEPSLSPELALTDLLVGKPKVVSMEADPSRPERSLGWTSRPGNWTGQQKESVVVLCSVLETIQTATGSAL